MKNEIAQILDQHANIPTAAVDDLINELELHDELSDFHETLTVLDECGNADGIVNLVEEKASQYEIEW